MTPEDLNRYKLYLKVDGNAEDALLEEFVTATKLYLKGVTGKTKVLIDAVEQDIETDTLWILTVKKIIARWYTHRGDNLPQTVAKEDASIEMLINHIAMRGDYV